METTDDCDEEDKRLYEEQWSALCEFKAYTDSRRGFQSEATIVEKRDKEYADSLKALFEAYPDLHSGPDKPRPPPSPSKKRIAKKRFTDEGDEVRKESPKKKRALRNSLGEFKAGRDKPEVLRSAPGCLPNRPQFPPRPTQSLPRRTINVIDPKEDAAIQRRLDIEAKVKELTRVARGLKDVERYQAISEGLVDIRTERVEQTAREAQQLAELVSSQQREKEAETAHLRQEILAQRELVAKLVTQVEKLREVSTGAHIGSVEPSVPTNPEDQEQIDLGRNEALQVSVGYPRIFSQT
jgi:hypothetical protein